MKLHLGCGDLIIPGFKGVDVRTDSCADVIADVRNLHMIGDNIVDEIYYCHGLEHIPENEVYDTLLEWMRVLKPGSWLYLAVPDFAILAYLYINDGWELAPPLSSSIMGGQDYEHNFHYSIWDYDKLVHVLDGAGYHHIGTYDAHRYLPSGFVDWSVRKVRGFCISLNVRAMT